MSKRPLREPDRREDARAPKIRNYITPGGLQRLKDEQRFLLNRERPAVTRVVAWAASNGDRSENADYQYNKRRLRQIDRRIRFLTQRIDAAEVVDPEAPRVGQAARKVFFGATVRYINGAGTERTSRIVGLAPGSGGQSCGSPLYGTRARDRARLRAQRIECAGSGRDLSPP